MKFITGLFHFLQAEVPVMWQKTIWQSRHPWRIASPNDHRNNPHSDLSYRIGSQE